MEDIYVGYQQDIMVLNGVSISCSDDFITGLIGPNGAGKSTLLKTLCGFLKPKNGSIYFEGEEVTGNDPHKMSQAGLIYLPQERGIFPSLTVKENLKLGTWIFRNDSEKVEKSMGRVQERFPILKEREDKQANMLSGGEQRMLEFGRALMLNPKFLLVDEPAAGLAPKVATGIYENLEEIAQNIGVLMVEQNVDKAMELSDYIYILKAGQILEEDNSENLIGKTDSLVRDWLI